MLLLFQFTRTYFFLQKIPNKEFFLGRNIEWLDYVAEARKLFGICLNFDNFSQTVMRLIWSIWFITFFSLHICTICYRKQYIWLCGTYQCRGPLLHRVESFISKAIFFVRIVLLFFSHQSPHPTSLRILWIDFRRGSRASISIWANRHFMGSKGISSIECSIAEMLNEKCPNDKLSIS